MKIKTCKLRPRAVLIAYLVAERKITSTVAAVQLYLENEYPYNRWYIQSAVDENTNARYIHIEERDRENIEELISYHRAYVGDYIVLNDMDIRVITACEVEDGYEVTE